MKTRVSGTQHPVPSTRTAVFVNERAAREEEEEDQHNTSACCHGNTGQLMRHQSQYKSFSVLAALFFFPLLPSGGVVVCHAASPLEAWENNRTFKETELCRLSSVNEAGGS